MVHGNICIFFSHIIVSKRRLNWSIITHDPLLDLIFYWFWTIQIARYLFKQEWYEKRRDMEIRLDGECWRYETFMTFAIITVVIYLFWHHWLLPVPQRSGIRPDSGCSWDPPLCARVPFWRSGPGDSHIDRNPLGHQSWSHQRPQTNRSQQLHKQSPFFQTPFKLFLARERLVMAIGNVKDGFF